MLNFTEITVLDGFEKVFLERLRDSYDRELRFTNPSDMQDIDRLLGLELQVHRLSRWLSADVDYNGDELADPSGIRRALQTYSETVGKLKERLRLDPASREKDQGETVAQRWDSLVRRAGKFGVHRINQARMAISLWNELHMLCSTWARANESERAKLGLSPEMIVNWVLNEGHTVFAQIDTDFRTVEQSLWSRNEDRT